MFRGGRKTVEVQPHNSENQIPSNETITEYLFFLQPPVLGISACVLLFCKFHLETPSGFQELCLSLLIALVARGTWAFLASFGSAHDVGFPCCQIPATGSAWRRQIRGGRARKTRPVGSLTWQPDARLSKL